VGVLVIARVKQLRSWLKRRKGKRKKMMVTR
jgi:hypothetical protein